MTDQPAAIGNVNNGKRRILSFPGYEGPVGFVAKPGGIAQIAYPSRRGMDKGTVVEIDGEKWCAVSRAASDWVSGMVVVDMKLVRPAEGKRHES